MRSSGVFRRSYADFDLARSLRQLRHELVQRTSAERNMQAVYDAVVVAERRIQTTRGAPISACEILELGPGQGLERARYFAVANEVVLLDRDVICIEPSIGTYIRMLRSNGFGRVIKSLGRHLVVGRTYRRAWDDLTGGTYRPMCQIDIDIAESPTPLPFDVIMSWSTLEHIADPACAVANLRASLKPGGVLYLSVHHYNSYNGHHDIRSFTNSSDAPAPWAHLDPATADTVRPSAFINQWTVAQWTELFDELLPGWTRYDDGVEEGRDLLDGLSQETRERLFVQDCSELETVDLVCVWQRP